MANYRKIVNRRLGVGNLEIRVLGDLDTLDHFMGMGQEITSKVREAQSKFADKYYTNLKKNLITGGATLGIEPNSPVYAEKKAKYVNNQNSDKAGYMMGNLYNSIVRVRGGKYGLVQVGVLKNTPRDILPPTSMLSHAVANQVTVDEYADFLERGTSKIPARPFFSKTYEKLGGNAGLVNFINRSLAQRMRVFNKY